MLCFWASWIYKLANERAGISAVIVKRFRTTSRFILKQLHYSLSISSCFIPDIICVNNNFLRLRIFYMNVINILFIGLVIFILIWRSMQFCVCFSLARMKTATARVSFTSHFLKKKWLSFFFFLLLLSVQCLDKTFLKLCNDDIIGVSAL